MYRRYYDGYGRVRNDNDSGEIITPHINENNSSEYRDNNQIGITSNETSVCKNSESGFLGLNCELDDIILIGILLFLLWDTESTDIVLLLIIGFIFLSELI